jgi:hypothetical protein
MSSVDAGYANLVNHAAAGSKCGEYDGPALTRVIPGNANDSLLFLKVHGYLDGGPALPCGNPMPDSHKGADGGVVSGEIPDGGQAIVVQTIQSWINEGAKP